MLRFSLKHARNNSPPPLWAALKLWVRFVLKRKRKTGPKILLGEDTPSQPCRQEEMQRLDMELVAVAAALVRLRVSHV